MRGAGDPVDAVTEAADTAGSKATVIAVAASAARAERGLIIGRIILPGRGADKGSNRVVIPARSA